MKMQKQYLSAFLFLCIAFTSCGSFGEGMLAGLVSMGNNYGGVGTGFTSMPNTTGGNMDYLLDPNYAVQQVLSQEEQEYQTFCAYNKKPDGSNYTKSEWRMMKGQAIQNMKNGESTYSSNSSSNGSSGNSSATSRTCKKLSVSDLAHCGGSGVCQRCNGQKRYWDNSFGNGHWVDPCIICGGTGKCPSCNGTGHR